jgi:hypothetical protein
LRGWKFPDLPADQRKRPVLVHSNCTTTQSPYNNPIRARRAYDRGLWRYQSLDLANAETPTGGVPFRLPRGSPLNSNCGSSNCSSRRRCISRRVSYAPGVSKTGIGAMSQNRSLRHGASPWIHPSATPRNHAGVLNAGCTRPLVCV